jgi:hypothetical protein
MSARLESFLVRLYVDAGVRDAFLADREGEAARALLTAEESAAVCRLDASDLQTAAHGFARKRAHKAAARGRTALPARFVSRLRAMIGR